MNEDYLWDRSGPPDPEVVHLETTLAPLRYRPVRVVRRRPRVWAWMAVAAAVLLCALAFWRRAALPPVETAWHVTTPAGAGQALRVGQSLRTADAGLSLEDEAVGQVDLRPNSELSASGGSRLRLERGQLHAYIWARPREFVVDTPGARAVDLGCEYTLRVDENGDGLIDVETGWVAFEYRGKEAFIPAGAECVTRKKTGPGLPYYADAPKPLRQSISALEAGDQSALTDVLASARPRDAITLWHLMTRVAPADRGAVFDRFSGLVKLPAGVSREAVLAGDAHSLDLCWNALNLEDTEWWRGWEREWK